MHSWMAMESSFFCSLSTILFCVFKKVLINILCKLFRLITLQCNWKWCFAVLMATISDLWKCHISRVMTCAFCRLKRGQAWLVVKIFYANMSNGRSKYELHNLHISPNDLISSALHFLPTSLKILQILLMHFNQIEYFKILEHSFLH